MPYPALDMVLLPVQTVTASTTQATTAEITVPEQYTSAIVVFTTGAATGTSPTLNCYIQEKIQPPAAGQLFGAQPSGTAIYSDVISFTQATGAATAIAQVVGGGNNCGLKSDKALAAGSVRSGPLGKKWIVTLVAGGTNPSFVSCSVMARFIP